MFVLFTLKESLGIRLLNLTSSIPLIVYRSIDDVEFESSADGIATVSRTGLVTAVAAGSVTITATYNDPLTSITLTDTIDITVS